MDINSSKTAPVEGLLPEIKNRWGPRAFSDKKVEKEKLDLLFEAARWAPSCYNQQPWRYIVGEKGGVGDYEGILKGLWEFNQQWAKNAPILIVTVASKIWDIKGHQMDGTPNIWAEFDLGQATSSLSIQAQNLGLYTHQMGGIITENLKKTLEIPEGYQVLSVMAVGYLGDIETLPEAFKEKEIAKRERKPVSSFVFTGKWGESYTSDK